MESLVDYSRQAEFDSTLYNIDPNQLHYIIGCGGVGFWLGIILAMQGCQHFVLIDGQNIERTNLNRLPVPPSWVGTNKAIALRKVMRSMRPVTAIRTVTKHIQEATLAIITEGGSDMFAGHKLLAKIVWDCTDDARIQKKLFKAMQANGDIQYRKLGYEGFQVGSYKAYDVWIPGDYAPGYRTSNACAATSALAAVLGIISQGLDISHDLEVNVKELVQAIPVVQRGVATVLTEATELFEP